MKRSLIFLLLFSLIQSVFAQDQQLQYELIRLGRIYSAYSGKTDALTPVTKQVVYEGMPTDQGKTREFLLQTLKSQNELLTEKYLTLPDTLTLRYLYIIRSVAWNQMENSSKKDLQLVDSLLSSPIQQLDQISCYYSMLFLASIAKNTPFYLSKVNFEPAKYNLQTPTERAIFFLESVATFSLLIDVDVQKQEFTTSEKQKCLTVFRQFPTYNGSPYYHFQDLDFEDFKYTINPEGSILSYRNTYLYTYMTLLQTHYESLVNENRFTEERADIDSNSILRSQKFQQFLDHDRLEMEMLQEYDKWLKNFSPDPTKQ